MLCDDMQGMFWVSREYRRQKIGTSLYNRMKKDYPKMYVESSKNNKKFFKTVNADCINED